MNDELKRLSKEARLGDLEIVSAGTFARPLPSSRLVRVYSRKAGVYLTDVIDRDNAALIVAAVNALPELLAKVKRLEEALSVIIAGAQLSEYDTLTDDRGLTMRLCGPNFSEDWTLGDFRRARAALKETGNG